MQEEYGYEDEELDEYMPNVDNIQEFKEIMEPKRVYILDVENDEYFISPHAAVRFKMDNAYFKNPVKEFKKFD